MSGNTMLKYLIITIGCLTFLLMSCNNHPDQAIHYTVQTSGLAVMNIITTDNTQSQYGIFMTVDPVSDDPQFPTTAPVPTFHPSSSLGDIEQDQWVIDMQKPIFLLEFTEKERSKKIQFAIAYNTLSTNGTFILWVNAGSTSRNNSWKMDYSPVTIIADRGEIYGDFHVKYATSDTKWQNGQIELISLNSMGQEKLNYTFFLRKIE